MVPHHGANMLLGGPLPDNQSSKRKFAIFSYGKENQYGHPSEKHIATLQGSYNYEVVRTVEYQYIKIIRNMRIVDISYRQRYDTDTSLSIFGVIQEEKEQ